MMLKGLIEMPHLQDQVFQHLPSQKDLQVHAGNVTTSLQQEISYFMTSAIIYVQQLYKSQFVFGAQFGDRMIS